jgi:hypothetical protein
LSIPSEPFGKPVAGVRLQRRVVTQSRLRSRDTRRVTPPSTFTSFYPSQAFCDAAECPFDRIDVDVTSEQIVITHEAKEARSVDRKVRFVLAQDCIGSRREVRERPSVNSFEMTRQK